MSLPDLTAGDRTALGVLAFACLVFLAVGALPWLGAWPDGWTLPATQWIGFGLEAFIEVIRPAARGVSWLLGFPMAWANALLTQTPWPVVAAAFIGLAFWVGGTRMAVMTAVALCFILASGYWVQSMNTLGLVVISVPLALSIGLLTGILAYEVKAVRQVVEVALDIMQTVPTFAYLTPLLLLFGFGPVIGLIASAIYAAPPMARNTLLGLERVDAEIREAAAMAGTTRLQRLVLVELPAASPQILVGVNQCIMAALSMVIIAAVIGGFDDIGWEVLLTMRKADFGQALLAGLVIVVFAIVIDRLSASLANTDHRGAARIALGIALCGGALGLAVIWLGLLPSAASISLLQPAAEAVDQSLSAFTAANGAMLDAVKNTAMFYIFLPLKIGLDDAVLPFTWGFSWTTAMSVGLFAVAFALGGMLALRGAVIGGVAVVGFTTVIHFGLTELPWPVVILTIAAIAWRVGGTGLAAFVTLALLSILLAGLWDRAMLSIYLCGAAVIACALAGGGLGLLAAVSPLAWTVLRPICDTLQTIPLFVFLIPVLMVFQIGEFSAFLAICAYAIVPMIRYTRHGLVTTPVELIEAAQSSGCTPWQTLVQVRAPYAAPTILLGLNQTILYAFAMLVIAALIGTTGLGQSIYIALGSADVGLGVASGAAMALLALIADRLVQAFAAERRAALGL
ncbi:MAG: ABC transporter permease subunit [Pseudomonadota bacterium]